MSALVRLGVGIAATSYLGPGAAVAVPAIGRAMGVCFSSGSDGVAITFDDGPHLEGTPRVLEALAAAEATATFFLVGEQVARHPHMVERIMAGGHRIGLHCHRHRCLLRLAPPQVRRDLDRAQHVIEDAAGQSVGIYRPPYGLVTAAALYYARRRGWRTLLWTLHAWDWTPSATPESIRRRITSGLQPGATILLHDSDTYSRGAAWRNTVPALPAILEAIRQRGLHTSIAVSG